MFSERFGNWLYKLLFHAVPEEVLTPEPDAPVKCPTCGVSVYLNDRNDDEVCDDCWIKAESARTESLAREYLEREKRMAEFRARGF